MSSQRALFWGGLFPVPILYVPWNNIIDLLRGKSLGHHAVARFQHRYPALTLVPRFNMPPAAPPGEGEKGGFVKSYWYLSNRWHTCKKSKGEKITFASLQPSKDIPKKGRLERKETKISVMMFLPTRLLGQGADAADAANCYASCACACSTCMSTPSPTPKRKLLFSSLTSRTSRKMHGSRRVEKGIEHGKRSLFFLL